MTNKENLQHQCKLTKFVLREMRIETPTETKLILKNQLLIMETLMELLPREKIFLGPG